MPRYTFQQLFRLIDPNTLEVLRKIKIGSFEIDAGARIDRGVNFAGIDLFNYLNADFEGVGESTDEVFDIERIFPNV